MAMRSTGLFDQRNRLTRNAFRAPDESELLGRRRFHVHTIEVELEICREIRAHRLSVLAKAGCFGDHCRIDIHDLVATLLQKRADMPYECAAVRTFPTLIAIGEVHADIAERGSAEQCIADGMQEHIAVRVRKNASRMRNLDAGERDEVPVRKRMHIEALSDSQPAHECPRAAKMRAARSRSGGVVILRLSPLPSTSFARNPNSSTACASSVTAMPCSAAALSARSRTPYRNICGVSARQRPARGTVSATKP